MKKFALTVGALLLVGTMVFAGGSSEAGSTKNTGSLHTTIDKPVTIEFWHSFSGTQVPVLEGLVTQFNETVGKEKGITVTPVAQGSGPQLYSKVIGAIKAGNAPAVTASKPPYVQDFIMADYVIDLKPYIEDPTVGMKDYDDFFKVFREESEAYSVPGIYSLPFAKNADVLYYNADFFQEHGLIPPKTWEDLEILGQKIHDITGKGAFGYDNVQYLFENLVKQYGGEYTDKEGNLLFAQSDAALEGLDMYAENVWKGIWRTVGEDGFFSGPFARGTIQMYIGGTVESQYINMKNPEFTWSAVPIPQKDLNNRFTLSYDHVICALNPKASPDVQYAAYEFIKFITSTEASKAITLGTSYMTVRESVLSDAEYKAYTESGKNDALKAATAQKDFLYFQPVFIADTYTSSTVDNEITSMMKRVLDNKEDPKAAIASVISTLK